MDEPSRSIDSEFQELLHKICQNLTVDDIEKMKFLLIQDLNRKDFEEVSSAEELMSLMKYKGLFTAFDRRRLVEVLDTIGLKTLANELENFGSVLYERRPGTRSTQEHERQLSEKHDFQRLLYQIGEELGEGDVNEMKFLLKSHVPNSKLEKAKTSFDVISLMQEVGLLTLDNTDVFLNILKDLKNAKCIEKFKGFVEMQRALKAIPYNINRRMIKKHFKANTETAKDLEKLLSQGSIVTLTGLLGSGKSQNALYFGCNYKEQNPEAVVWRCLATDKKAFQSSLRQLANGLGISKPRIETISPDEDITILQDLILKNFQTGYVNGNHLLIIDDASLECKEVIEKFVHTFLESEKKNTKFIVTTNVKYMLEEYQQLPTKGFSEKESIAFLSDEQIDTIDKQKFDELGTLAATLGYNPMGIYLAKSYMKTNHISPKQFLKYIGKKENVEIIEEDFSRRNLHADDKLLFNTLKFQIFTNLRKCLPPNIFKMFQVLQFLKTDDVPLLLLDFISHENIGSSSVITNSFVQALQMNSFGDLYGEDDTRFLTLHSAILLTLEIYTITKDKTELLKSLVWAMVLLLGKDVFLQKDYVRQKLMLPHLRSVLKHSERILDLSSLENQLLLLYLNDVTGYLHYFEGMSQLGREYSEKARHYCFQILGETEHDIDEKIKLEITASVNEREIDMLIEEDFIVFEQFTNHKAKYIYRKMISIAESQKDVLNAVVPTFVSSRYKVPANMQLIEECIGDTELAMRLTVDEYKLLEEKEMAIPYNIMEKLFLPELYLSLFYSCGRRLFFIDDKQEKALARKSFEYLYLAKKLGDCIILDNPHFLPINTLLAERNGTLETCFLDNQPFEKDHLLRLKAAVDSFKKMFQDDKNYFSFGVIKMKAADDNHHKVTCLTQLLRCFTKMIDLEPDQDKQNQIYQDGCKHADQILDVCSNAVMKERRCVPGIHVRVSQFYLSFTRAQPDYLQKALKILFNLCPKYLMEDTVDGGIVSCMKWHEKEAAYGLIEYYIRSKEREKAKDLLNAVRSNIIVYGEEKDQTKLFNYEERIQGLDTE